MNLLYLYMSYCTCVYTADTMLTSYTLSIELNHLSV